MFKKGDRFVIEIEDSCEGMLFRVKGIPHVLLTKYDLEALPKVRKGTWILRWLFFKKHKTKGERRNDG